VNMNRSNLTRNGTSKQNTYRRSSIFRGNRNINMHIAACCGVLILYPDSYRGISIHIVLSTTLPLPIMTCLIGSLVIWCIFTAVTRLPLYHIFGKDSSDDYPLPPSATFERSRRCTRHIVQMQPLAIYSFP
jgi:hypothetical protein